MRRHYPGAGVTDAFFSAYRIDAEWVRVTLLGPLDDPKLNDILASLPGATVTAIN